MVVVDETEIRNVRVVRPKKHADERGWLAEVWQREAFRNIGIDDDWIQDNHSRTELRWTIRGLHFQRPPYVQAKLVRVLRGAIMDVAVDLRAGSQSFGRHVALTLNAERLQLLYVPPGFAHGFLTLTDNVEILYKADRPYSPAHEGGIHWADPTLNIAWPLPAGTTPVISQRDASLPQLAEVAPISGGEQSR